MKKSIKITLWLVLAAAVVFVLASMLILADLRTSDIKNSSQSEEQILLAQNLLKKTVIKQGLDKADQFTTYEIIGSDHWKGLMGKMGNPWSWNGDKMALRYSVGDFDGQVEALEGAEKGFVAGLQSWDYYEKPGGEYQTNVEDNKGIMFILAAFHYFSELAPRLSSAPFIRYAGKDQLKGKEIEKVFVSWGNENTKDYDQYVLWIGKESELIEAVEFTTRDNFKPAPSFIWGSLRFDDYRSVDGILIPFKQTAFIGNPKENTDDYIHQLKIDKFEWDKFPVSDIRPFSELKSIGDDKPQN